MPWPWQGREREADQLEELASLLDAGFDAQAALSTVWPGGPLPDLEQGLVPALRRALPRLSEIDAAVLTAAELSGDLGRALRARAGARKRNRRAGAALLLRLAYPLFVLLLGCAVILFLSLIGMGGLLWLLPVVLGLIIALALTALWLRRRALRDPAFSGRGMPGLQGLLRDLGELPYLEALADLHAAGVPIDHAHDLALRTAAIASVRARLTAAASGLASRRGLVESLSATDALSEESLAILGPAESSGQLEDALLRSATRRREVMDRRITAATAAVGAIAYLAAVLLVAAVVIDFYSRLYSGLGR